MIVINPSIHTTELLWLCRTIANQLPQFAQQTNWYKTLSNPSAQALFTRIFPWLNSHNSIYNVKHSFRFSSRAFGISVGMQTSLLLPHDPLMHIEAPWAKKHVHIMAQKGHLSNSCTNSSGTSPPQWNQTLSRYILPCYFRQKSLSDNGHHLSDFHRSHLVLNHNGKATGIDPDISWRCISQRLLRLGILRKAWPLCHVLLHHIFKAAASPHLIANRSCGREIESVQGSL